MVFGTLDPNDTAGGLLPSPTVRTDEIMNAFREEFPALSVPAGVDPVGAVLLVLRKLYPVGQHVMRGNIAQAMTHAVDAMPNGPDPARPLRVIEPDPDGMIPRRLRDAAQAWDGEFRTLCQTLVNIGAGPGSPQEKQAPIVAAIKRFMGVHERVQLQFMCLRPPPER
jgi:hypothetical protein